MRETGLGRVSVLVHAKSPADLIRSSGQIDVLVLASAVVPTVVGNTNTNAIPDPLHIAIRPLQLSCAHLAALSLPEYKLSTTSVAIDQFAIQSCTVRDHRFLGLGFTPIPHQQFPDWLEFGAPYPHRLGRQHRHQGSLIEPRPLHSEVASTAGSVLHHRHWHHYQYIVNISHTWFHGLQVGRQPITHITRATGQSCHVPLRHPRGCTHSETDGCALVAGQLKPSPFRALASVAILHRPRRSSC